MITDREVLSGYVEYRPQRMAEMSPQGRHLVNFILSLTTAELDQLDDELAAWGEVTGITDGTTDGVEVLVHIINRTTHE